jgi:hypothetical protein
MAGTVSRYLLNEVNVSLVSITSSVQIVVSKQQLVCTGDDVLATL